jgi:hypothetical protein
VALSDFFVIVNSRRTRASREERRQQWNSAESKSQERKKNKWKELCTTVLHPCNENLSQRSSLFNDRRYSINLTTESRSVALATQTMLALHLHPIILSLLQCTIESEHADTPSKSAIVIAENKNTVIRFSVDTSLTQAVISI